MIGSDTWFRWCFNIFLFLVCLQLGMLMAYKGIIYSAEQRLQENEAEFAYSCGDFDNPEAYWDIPKDKILTQTCLDPFCPDSYWENPAPQTEALHVLSVKKPQAPSMKGGDKRPGFYVDVEVKSSPKPQTLALISKHFMQWNLKVSEGSQLQEVLILGSELVMIDGLPEDVKLTYFPKEKLCAFPTAWEELKNPDNQFRRLYLALGEYRDLEISSFQGQDVGRRLQVPFTSPLIDKPKLVEPITRSISSTEVGKKDHFSLGIHWLRDKKSLKAGSFHFVKEGQRQKVAMPDKSSHGIYSDHNDTIYIINNFQFGSWNWKDGTFKPIHAPLALPALYWPTAMTMDPETGDIYIYNDDRGGEILAYNVKSQSWRMAPQKVGYSLVALFYNSEKKLIYGAHFSSKKISKLIKVSPQGKVIESQSFPKPFDFSKNQWRAQFVSDNKEFWLKLSHPVHPGGDIYPFSQMNVSL